LEAFSATPLNSVPVQALAVFTSEIVPAATAANNAAMMDSVYLQKQIAFTEIFPSPGGSTVTSQGWL
jgi:hypothetical protein